MLAKTALVVCLSDLNDLSRPWQKVALDLARTAFVEGHPVFVATDHRADTDESIHPFLDTTLPETLEKLGVSQVLLAGSASLVHSAARHATTLGFQVSVVLPASEPEGDEPWPRTTRLLSRVPDLHTEGGEAGVTTFACRSALS